MTIKFVVEKVRQCKRKYICDLCGKDFTIRKEKADYPVYGEIAQGYGISIEGFCEPKDELNFCDKCLWGDKEIWHSPSGSHKELNHLRHYLINCLKTYSLIGGKMLEPTVYPELIHQEGIRKGDPTYEGYQSMWWLVEILRRCHCQVESLHGDFDKCPHLLIRVPDDKYFASGLNHSGGEIILRFESKTKNKNYEYTPKEINWKSPGGKDIFCVHDFDEAVHLLRSKFKVFGTISLTDDEYYGIVHMPVPDPK